VEVREPIELSFGVVSGMGPGIGVLDAVDVLQGERGGVREVSWNFSPHWFEWRIVKQKCIRLVCEISLETFFHWLSDDIIRFKIEVGFTSNLQKCNIHSTSWLRRRRL